MIEFEIPTMTCGHCVGVITKTVHSADPAARVDADLARHAVRVETSQSREALAEALTKAGYPTA